MARKEKDQKGQSILSMDVGELFKKQFKKNVPQQGAPKSTKNMIKETKRTMNFVHHESGLNVRNVTIIALVAVIALVIFVKIGFLDPLNEQSVAYNLLSFKQDELDKVQKRLGEFENLEQQYGRYSYGRMDESEINLVNRMDVLELVETEIASRAFIDNFAVNNNVLTMNIYGITLEQASTIVNSLESNELVSSASVNSATADDGVEAKIFISIVLAKVVEEAE